MDKKQSRRMKKLWQDPQYRAKMKRRKHWSATAKKRKAIGEKISLGKKLSWSNISIYDKAKIVAKISEQAKKNWKDPVTKAKYIAHLTKWNASKEKAELSSESVKKLWQDPQYRAEQKAARKYDAVWKAKTVAATKKANTGRAPWNKGLSKDTDSRLMKTSLKLKGRVPDYNKYRAWYDGANGKIRMRSKWEVAYAQYLDRKGIAWQYEPRYFNIGKGDWPGISYTPDFYLTKEKKYIEVKGRLLDKDQNKLARFQQKYPKIKWQLLQRKDLVAIGVLDIYGCAKLKARAATA